MFVVLTSVCSENCTEAVRLSPCWQRPPQTEPRASKPVPGAASPSAACVSIGSVRVRARPAWLPGSSSLSTRRGTASWARTRGPAGRASLYCEKPASCNALSLRDERSQAPGPCSAPSGAAVACHSSGAVLHPPQPIGKWLQLRKPQQSHPGDRVPLLPKEVWLRVSLEPGTFEARTRDCHVHLFTRKAIP